MSAATVRQEKERGKMGNGLMEQVAKSEQGVNEMGDPLRMMKYLMESENDAEERRQLTTKMRRQGEMVLLRQKEGQGGSTQRWEG